MRGQVDAAGGPAIPLLQFTQHRARSVTRSGQFIPGAAGRLCWVPSDVDLKARTGLDLRWVGVELHRLHRPHRSRRGPQSLER